MSKVLRNIGGVKLSKELQNQLFSKLAELLEIGFSVNQALDFIGHTYSRLAEATQIIIDHLQMGDSFAQSCSGLAAGEIVDQLKIAEQHGQLQGTLQQLAKFNTQRIEQHKKIKALLVYPIILIIILVILLGLIHSILLPQINDLNGDQGETPNNIPIILICFGLVIILLLAGLILKKLSAIQRYNVLVKIPLIGKLVRQYVNYYLANNLAVLLSNGLTGKDILTVIQQFSSRSLIYELGTEISHHLQRGDSYNMSLNRHSLIAPELVSLLDSGETVTEMSRLMTAYSQLMFTNLIRDSDKLIALMQPTIFVAIGMVVTSAYLQILMPIYQSIRGIY